MPASCSRPDADLAPAYRKVPVPHERLASPAARARGRALFLADCAPCHGVAADGRGVRRPRLATAPTDLTHLAPPRRRARRLFQVLHQGVPGTDMPAWSALSDDQRWDLVAYLQSLAGNGDELSR